MWNKLKDACRNNKAAVITAATLVLSLATIIAITAAANRARSAPVVQDDKQPTVTTTTASTSHTTVTPPAATTTPAVTAGTTAGTSSAAQVADEPPALILPVSGALMKGHDAALQVFSNTMQDYRVHQGIDIASALGSPVYAVADGTVSAVWEDVYYGMCISVTHTGDCVSHYKNLDPEIAGGIKVGATVKQGQLLASVGESAMIEIADEPHLHFELTVDGENVDPTEYFDSASVAILDRDTAFEG